MPLTGPQLDPIASAIQTAYDRDELRKVLTARLNLNFDDYAPEKGYTTQLWTFLQALNRQDRIPEIVRCLQAEQPTNTALQAVRTTLEPGFTPAATPISEPSPLPLAAVPAGTIIHVAGDYIVGNVGSNSPNVAIGKDITQTVTTPTPPPVTPVSTAAPASKPAEPPPAKAREKWFSSVWTLVLAPIIVGVVLLLVTQWVQRQDDATVTAANAQTVDVSRGQTKQITVDGMDVSLTVPSDPSPIAPLSATGGVPVVLVVNGTSASGTVKLGECLLANGVTAALLDVQNPGVHYARFSVAKVPAGAAPPLCVNATQTR